MIPSDPVLLDSPRAPEKVIYFILMWQLSQCQPGSKYVMSLEITASIFRHLETNVCTCSHNTSGQPLFSALFSLSRPNLGASRTGNNASQLQKHWSMVSFITTWRGKTIRHPGYIVTCLLNPASNVFRRQSKKSSRCCADAKSVFKCVICRLSTF